VTYPGQGQGQGHQMSSKLRKCYNWKKTRKPSYRW